MITSCSYNTNEESPVTVVTLSDSTYANDGIIEDHTTIEDDAIIEDENISVDGDSLKGGVALDTPILPIPSAAFLNTIDSFAGIDFIMEKYITLNFSLTTPLKTIKYTTASHPEGVYPCLTRTEYGPIATETLTCDSYSITKTIEFTDYSIEEVRRLMEILLATQSYDRDEDGWHEGEYIYSDGMCSLDLQQVKNKIIVSYGCSC